MSGHLWLPHWGAPSISGWGWGCCSAPAVPRTPHSDLSRCLQHGVMGGWWQGRPELKEASPEASSRTSSSASLLSLMVTRPSLLPQVPSLHDSQHPEGKNCDLCQPVRIGRQAAPWVERCYSAATGPGWGPALPACRWQCQRFKARGWQEVPLPLQTCCHTEWATST